MNLALVPSLVLALVAVPPAAAGPTAPGGNADPAATAPAAARLTRQVNDALGLRASRVVTVQAGDPGTAFETTIPLGEGLYTLDVRPRSLRAPGFRILHQVAGGALIDVAPGPVRTLRGAVRDVPGSRVAGALLDDGLHLTVSVPGQGRYWLEPVAGRAAGAGPDDHVVYRDEDVIPSGGSCGVEGAGGPGPGGAGMLDAVAAGALSAAAVPAPLPADSGGGIAGDDPTCYFGTELACDADYPYFQAWGEDTEERIESVIAAVNVQYELQVEISHVITAIVVRTSEAADPYSSNSAGTLLGQFRDHWESQHAGIPRDVAHLFTGRELNGTTIGIAATIGGICTSFAYCLSQSDCCAGFACSTDLTAHELGHLWNGFHCSCPGFTMNPTITCANQFSGGTIASIVSHRNSRWCLSDVCVEQANDVCAAAQEIPAGTTLFSTIGALTDGPAEPGCFGGDGQVGSDVWFRYRAECDGLTVARLCDSSYDTRLAVYEATCPSGPGAAIGCDDDTCGLRSQVLFDAVAGTEYIIRVGGAASVEGLGELTVGPLECPGACPTDTNRDGETDVLDLTIVVLAWDTDDGVADVNGDGTVDVDDLTAVILAWGACPD